MTGSAEVIHEVSLIYRSPQIDAGVISFRSSRVFTIGVDGPKNDPEFIKAIWFAFLLAKFTPSRFFFVRLQFMGRIMHSGVERAVIDSVSRLCTLFPGKQSVQCAVFKSEESPQTWIVGIASLKDPPSFEEVLAFARSHFEVL